MTHMRTSHEGSHFSGVMRIVLFVIFSFHLVALRCTADPVPVCQPHSTCHKCLKSPGCVWCKQKGFLKSGESDEMRCDSVSSLTIKNCTDMVDPKPSTMTKKNNDLSSDENNVVQLKPQSMKIRLRIGVPQEFRVEFKRAEGYPIDLYYLMDLSYSMKDDLENIKNLGQDILKTLQNVTKSVRIGFGSFVDKEKLPYVSQVKSKRKNPCPTRTTCQPAFTFRNVLPLTSDPKEFKEKVSKQNISGNLDSPEAGLDAIMQAAVCQKIGWKDVTRILVYTSDDTFHMAGDGRLAGIFTPNDGQCHLKDDGSYDGTLFDYPSIGRLSHVLQTNNIQLIFAVTENSFPAYQALSALIPQSVVAVLKNDSSNVVQLISEAYGNLSSTLLLEHDFIHPGLQISYKSDCNHKMTRTWHHRVECTGIRTETVSFTVRLNATECLDGSKSFNIIMKGIKETVNVTVETLCNCECDDVEKNSLKCTGTGTFECGVCSCNNGYLGQRCDCKTNEHDMRMLCRSGNGSECNGNGECKCGKCECNRQFSGTHCECNNSNCTRGKNQKLCSGEGDCKCSKCVCNANYTGEACDCPTNTSGCIQSSGKKCSGRGECKCNHCECEEDFMGNFCSQIHEPCAKYNICADSILDVKNCSTQCPMKCKSIHFIEKKGTHMKCVHKSITYDVEVKDDGSLVMIYAELPITVDKTKVIIGSSVSSIIFIGLLFILIYKILLYLYDRREYQNFLKAQENTKWDEANNPLYKGATTTVLNPLHTHDN